MCAAAGRAVLRTIDAEGLITAAAVHGETLLAGLEAGRTERMGQVRGRGLAIGIEIVDPVTGEADPGYARRVVFRAWQLGVVVFYVGGSVLEITPPLTISARECQIAIDALTRAIAEADAVSDADIAPFAGW